MQGEILALNAILYSDISAQTWQGGMLWTAFQNHKPDDVAGKDQLDPLQPLFKI